MSSPWVPQPQGGYVTPVTGVCPVYKRMKVLPGYDSLCSQFGGVSLNASGANTEMLGHNGGGPGGQPLVQFSNAPFTSYVYQTQPVYVSPP